MQMKLEYPQIRIHLLESGVGLLEEAIDDAFTEFSLIVILVQFQNLLEGGQVDTIAEFGVLGRPLLALHSYALVCLFKVCAR